MSKGVTGQEGKTAKELREFLANPGIYSAIDFSNVIFFPPIKREFIAALRNAKQLFHIKLDKCALNVDIIQDILNVYSPSEDVFDDDLTVRIMEHGSYDKSLGNSGLSYGASGRVNLRSLELPNNKLEKSVIEKLLEFIANYNFLTEVNLSGCNVGNTGLTSIVDLLQEKKDVITIRISNEKFDQDIIEGIKSAARGKHNIYLGEKQLTSAGHLDDHAFNHSNNSDIELGGGEEEIFGMNDFV